MDPLTPQQAQVRGDITNEQLRAAVKVQVEIAAILLTAIEEATEKSPLGGVPNGHLYAAVMGVLDIDTYTRLIDILKESGKVTEKFHLLSYVKSTGQ